MSLFDVITDEQLLNLALTHICERDEDKIDPVAERICIFYALKQLNEEQNYDPTDEELHRRYSEMVVEKIIEQLSKKGMVEVDYGYDDVSYSITDEGKEKLRGN